MKPPTAKQYIEAARELHQIDGEVEIDDLDETDAEAEQRVSRSEDPDSETGAYVKAWVWVNREEIQPNYAEDEEKSFVNHYRCEGNHDCRTQHEPLEWTDTWSCACNDRCPTCRTEMEPYESEEL